MIAVKTGRVLFAAAALAALATPALAKDDLADRANQLAEQANDVQAQAAALSNEALDVQADRHDDRNRRDRDGDHFPWGILGLLGLAGLAGLRRPPHRVDRTDRVDPLGRDPRL